MQLPQYCQYLILIIFCTSNYASSTEGSLGEAIKNIWCKIYKL
jgi:hypothetical protein